MLGHGLLKGRRVANLTKTVDLIYVCDIQGLDVMTHEHCKRIKSKIKVSIQTYFYKLFNICKFAHYRKTHLKFVFLLKKLK